MRRVFRDYIVILVSNRLTAGSHEDMLKPIGFGRVETIHDDQKAIGLIKKLKANLVVASRSLMVFSGAQLLSAAREDRATKEVPFLIIGDKEDLKPGGLADQVKKFKSARLVALPSSQEEFVGILLELLDPLIDPKQEEAYGLMDLAEEQIGRMELVEATASYARALELHPPHLVSWLKLAGLQADLERFEEAETSYFKALRLNNYSLAAYFGLAELYERRQDYDQTIGLLHQALGVAQMLKVSSNSVSRINFYIGEFELRLRRLTGAKEAFGQAIELSPDDAHLHVDIGDSYAQKGYLAESEEHYRTALEIDPNLAHVFNRLGIAYRRQGKFDKALQLYDNARLHHPDDEHLLFNIARAHFEAEQHQKAEMMLEEALLMTPDFKAANYLIAKLKATVKEIDQSVFEKSTQNQTITPTAEDRWRRESF